MKKILIIGAFFLALGCKKDGSSGNCQRSGAVCKDGTTTHATGSGACSGHGGVDHWLCK